MLPLTLSSSFSLWNGRTSNVNYDMICILINFKKYNCIPFDKKRKCETCIQEKLTRSSFEAIEKNSKPLDLIHTDVSDLKTVQTLGRSKYFITFVVDNANFIMCNFLKVNIKTKINLWMIDEF